MSEDTNVPQMRETIERLSKDKAGLEKEVSDLTKAVRVFEAKDAFRSAGYNPNNGELYAAYNPEGEITAESVADFADRHGLAAIASGTQESAEEAGGSTSQETDGSEQLAALSGGGSRAGDGGAGGADVKTLTRQEWQQLHASDPAAARAAVASGRVEVTRDNVFAREAGGAAPVGNPYANFGSE